MVAIVYTFTVSGIRSLAIYSLYFQSKFEAQLIKQRKWFVSTMTFVDCRMVQILLHISYLSLVYLIYLYHVYIVDINDTNRHDTS